MSRKLENLIICTAVIFSLVVILMCAMCISGTVDQDVFKSYLDIRQNLALSISILAAIIALPLFSKWLYSKRHH